MKEPLLATKRFNSNVYGAIAAFGFFILMDCLFIALLFFQDAGLKGELFFVGGGILFVFITTKIFHEIFYLYGVYEVYEDRIIVHSITGKLKDTIMRKDIISWSEFTVQKRRKTDYILTLYTSERNIVIRSEYIGKEVYNKFKYIVTPYLPRNIISELKRELRNAILSRNLGMGMIVFLTIIFLKYWYSDAADIKSIKPTTITKQISRPSKLVYDKKYLELYVAPAPDSIEIDNESFAAFNSANFISDVHAGDMVEVDEITTKPSGALESIFGSSHLYICGIRSHGFSYLNYDDFIYARKHDNQYVPLYFGLILFVFLYFTYSSIIKIRTKKKELENLDSK